MGTTVVWRIRDGRPLARLSLRPQPSSMVDGAANDTNGEHKKGIEWGHTYGHCVCSCFPASTSYLQGDLLMVVNYPQRHDMPCARTDNMSIFGPGEFKVAVYDWQGVDAGWSGPNGLVGSEDAGIQHITSCSACSVGSADGVLTRYIDR